MCFGLWAYAAVAAQTMTAILPLPFILPPSEGNCTAFLDPHAQVNPQPLPQNDSFAIREPSFILSSLPDRAIAAPFPTYAYHTQSRSLASVGVKEESSYPVLDEWNRSVELSDPAPVTYDIRCKYSYLFFLAIFALVVIPVSCLELTEQKWMQVRASFRRILVALPCSCPRLPFTAFPPSFSSIFFLSFLSCLCVLLLFDYDV